MKQLLVFVRKEFYHVFRDRRTLLIMFGLPLMQILLFGFALTSDVKNVTLLIMDNSHDTHAEALIGKVQGSGYFNIKNASYSTANMEEAFKKAQANAALVIPANFGKDLVTTKNSSVQVIVDGSEPNTAKLITQYITSIVLSYQQEINPPANLPATILVEPRMLYNEEANGSMNFIPGVIALILMIVSTALTSVAVVREKELGTMEILLVSPFKPLMVLLAKTIPFLVLSLCNFTLILLLSVFVMKVPILGSLPLLYAETLLFIFTSLAFGLLISNSTDSQQVALLISFMAMMLPTLMFTGFLYPIENMPLPFRIISNVVPAKWYYSIVKSVMLKGLGFQYVWKETLVLLGMSVIVLGIAIRKFKTRLS